MPLVIGSEAINYNDCEQYGNRYDLIERNDNHISDTDLIMEPNEAMDLYNDHKCSYIKGFVTSKYPLSSNKFVVESHSGLFEIEVAYEGSSAAELLKYAADNLKEPLYASCAMLLMLKMSHRYLKDSPHFHKTMLDINNLVDAGVRLDDELERILKIREAETYDYSAPNLDRTKEEFFSGDGVNYIFDHDSIHLAVAVADHGQPAYKSFSSSDKEVLVDMNKFMTLDHEIQLAAVYEEACVLALERSVIPHGVDQAIAFKMALEKVCTSITSGRFREFAWNNYHEVLEFKDKQPLYTLEFFKGIHDGVVEPYQKITDQIG